MVTQWFDPETGSATIPAGIARALSKAGNDVHVVTGFPNYPGGRLYDGYRLRPVLHEPMDGMVVSRVILYPSHDRSPLRRILNFISFMVSSSTIGVRQLRSMDVVLVYSTPGTVGMAGIILRRLFDKRFVLYIADLWPDTLTATGMLPHAITPLVEAILHRFCDAVYAAADTVLVTSPGMKERIVARGVPQKKVVTVYNWVDESVFCPATRRSPIEDRFEVMYAGNIGDVQGLETAVQAMTLLPVESGIILRIVGSGVAKARVKALAASLGLADRVAFESPRAPAEMSSVMATADIQLVSLRDDPLFYVTMPSKIQAILASAQPLIVSAPGDAALLANRSGAGWSVVPGDARALADAILLAQATEAGELNRMALRGRHYYEANLSSCVGMKQLSAALEHASANGALRAS